MTSLDSRVLFQKPCRLRKEQKADTVTYSTVFYARRRRMANPETRGIPLWILYELGLLLAYLFVRKEKRPQA